MLTEEEAKTKPLPPGVGKYDGEIKILWPGRLERCENTRQRQTVRKAYRRHTKMATLKADGSKCSNCFSYENPGAQESRCEIECDWQTLCVVPADGLCLKWGPRPHGLTQEE